MFRSFLLALSLLAASARLPANEAVPLPEGEAQQPRAAQNRAGQEEGAAPAGGALRTREGTTLKDALGTFRSTGERLTFHSADGEQRLVVLENVALERVMRVLKENGSASQWLVSGTITECQGTNYLLLTRTILKHRKAATLAAPPAAKTAPAAKAKP